MLLTRVKPTSYRGPGSFHSICPRWQTIIGTMKNLERVQHGLHSKTIHDSHSRWTQQHTYARLVHTNVLSLSIYSNAAVVPHFTSGDPPELPRILLTNSSHCIALYNRPWVLFQFSTFQCGLLFFPYACSPCTIGVWGGLHPVTVKPITGTGLPHYMLWMDSRLRAAQQFGS